MDFFSRQESSRRTTRLLVTAFALAFAAIVAATTALAAFVLHLYSPGNTLRAGAGFTDWAAANAGLLSLIAAGTLAAMLLASLYRTASLSRGGGQVARMLGATEIPADTGDLARRRLLNVVEEMSIAAGLPVPEVYVLEEESGINAFAAGLTPSDAAIAVTRGALERLDRAELQGVVAHEVSHIVNGDMRLNQRLIGLSFGILVLSLIGRAILRGSRFGGRRYRSRRGSAAGAMLFLGAALAVIGGIGLLASRLIKAAVSRQRELLADASAVQFTRESLPLASALKKIGGHTSRFTSVDGEEVAHMLFERGVRGFSGWFATHPPLVDRIRLLDPSFDGEYPAAAVAGTAPSPAAAAFARADGTAAELAGPAMAAAAPAAGAHMSGDFAAESLLERAGGIETPEVGAALREAVPADLYDAAHSRESVWLLVLALALAPRDQERERQLDALETRLGPARARRCAELRAALDGMDAKLRIPLLEIAMPALKHRPAEQVDFLLELVTWLAELDGERQLHEYVLLCMLRAYLEDSPAPAVRRAPKGPHGGRARGARDALVTLIAAVAAHGHARGEDAAAAFRAGCDAIGVRPLPEAPDFGSGAAGDLIALDAALERLKHLPPRHKRTALKAVLATIRHDRTVTIEEVELFRALAASLGCPVPPLAGLDPAVRCAATG